MIDFDIDTNELDRMIRDVGALSTDAEKALKSTLIKMARWLKTRSVRGLSAELAMKQAIIRRRLRSTRVRDTPLGPQVKLWYGLNPVGIVWLNPRKSGDGMDASNGKHYKGAFPAKKTVFKRVGRARLPIEVVKEPIKTESDGYLERGIINSSEFAEQFYNTFEHELSWRMQQRR